MYNCQKTLGSMDVEVRLIDEIKGNGLFVTKPIKDGSVIFEETPMVCTQFSWNAAYGYKACDHCLRPLETAEENARRLTGKRDIILPYTECCTTDKTTIVSCSMCGVEYCTPDCLNAAFNQYHKVLCKQNRQNDETHPLNVLNEAWKQIHYPPETSSIMLIPRILATILQSPNREECLSRFLHFCHKSVNEDAELTHKFLKAKFADQVSTLRELTVGAVPNNGVEQLLTPSGFEALLALIGTNGQGVGTSPVSQWVTRSSELPLADADKRVLDGLIDKLYEDMDAQSGNFLNAEGIALFSLQSRCNHSCTPNTEAAYLHNNSTVSLVALRDIEVGEEVCISYLDECSLHRSRHSRQKVLKENYLFVCSCDKCVGEGNDPDVTSDEEEDMSE